MSNIQIITNLNWHSKCDELVVFKNSLVKLLVKIIINLIFRVENLIKKLFVLNFAEARFENLK